MKTMFTTALAAFMILCVGMAAADEKQDVSKPAAPAGPSFSGTVFTNYVYVVNGTDGANCNKFDVERFYFTMKTALDQDWKLQMTTDVYRNTTAGTYYGGLAVRLKFGFLDYTPFSGMSVKMGMIPGPWNSVVETQWRYRGVASTATDKYGYIPTADLGVSATYALPGKIGEVAGYVMNGDGYTAIESNKFKDVAFRATLLPFAGSEALKGVMLGGVAYLGKAGTNTALEKNRFGGLVAYSNAIVTLGTEYDIRKDAPSNPDTVLTGNVTSVFGELKAPFAGLESKLSIIGRYDITEPNTKKGGDMTRFLVAGLVFRPNERIAFSFDHQIVFAEQKTLKRTDGVMLDRDRRWFIHAIVTF